MRVNVVPMRWLIACSFVLIAACAGGMSRDNTEGMISLEGVHKDMLVVRLGEPDEILTAKNGDEILVYTLQRRVTRTAHAGDKPPATAAYTAYRKFWLDADGIVYRWAWEGR